MKRERKHLACRASFHDASGTDNEDAVCNGSGQAGIVRDEN